MKKISFLLILALALTLCAACSTPATETTETIFYEDGSYLVITTVASGHMTTDIIENPAEVMPQSNQSQEFICSPLSNFSTYEEAEQAVRDREEMEFHMGRYVTWILNNGLRIRVELNGNGMPRYYSEIATKYCSYYSADDQLLWTMSLTGIFRENAIDRNCDVVSTNITIFAQDNWYVIAEAEDKAIDDVFYTVHFGRKALGVTVSEPSYTLTLSRGEDGSFQ